MRIRLLTKINAGIALILGALGVTSCGSGIFKRNSVEAMYGPPEDMYGVPYVDDTIVVFTQTGEDQVTAILEIACHRFPVIADETLTVGYHPQTAFAVFYHRVDGV